MNPFQLFFVLLIIIPATEIYFLIQVGGVLGGFSTVLLILFTAFIGVYLCRLQGMAVVQRIQAMLARGEMPAIEVIEAVLLIVCGVLLFMPGFITDIIGFICLLPMLRQRIALLILAKQNMSKKPSHSSTTTSAKGDMNIIEGEFERDDEKDNNSLK